MQDRTMRHADVHKRWVAVVWATVLVLCAPTMRTAGAASDAGASGDFSVEAPPALLALLQKLQASQLRDVLESPVMVLVAPQSSGKSLFIDHLAGYPVTYSDSRMATACPVRYSFRQSAVKRCFVGGREVPLTGVADAVRVHMQDLAGRISNVELLVVIEDPQVLPMEIVDQPGFPAKDAPHYAKTVELIRQSVSKPGVIIVTVCRGEAVDTEAQMHVQLLDEVLSPVRPGWKKEHVMIQNFVNSALENMHSVAELEAYFTVPLDANKNTYFVLMNPDRVDLAHMSAEKKRDAYLSARRDGELRKFEEQVGRIESGRGSGAKFSKRSSVLPHLGVRLAHEALQRMLLAALQSSLSAVRERAKARKAEVERQANELEQQLKVADLVELRRVYADFVTGFVASFRALTDSRRTIVHQNRGGGYEANDEVLEPQEYAQTFDEEFAQVRAMMATKYDTVAEYVTQRTTDLKTGALAKRAQSATSLAKRLDLRLSGDSAVARLLHMYGIVLMLEQGKKDSLDEIFSVCGAQPSGASMTCDVKKAILHIVSKEVTLARRTLPWLCVHLEYLLSQRSRDAMEFRLRLDESQSVAAHTGFFRFLMDEMQKLIGLHVRKLQGDIALMIDEHEAALRLDAPGRMMAAVVLMPTDPFSRSGRPVRAPMEEREKDELRPTPEGEERAPETMENGELLRGRQERMAELQDALYKQRTHFTMLDAVEGGTVDVVDHTYIDVEPAAIYEQAQKHVYMAKLDVLLSIERTVNARLAQYFKNQYLNDFQKRMTDAVGAITEEQAAGWRMDAVPVEVLRGDLAATKSKLEEFRELETALLVYDSARKRM